MKGDLLLGIDLGTSSVKAALFDAATLNLTAVSAQEYPVEHPQPGFAEQDPREWWKNASQVVRDLCRQSPSTAVVGIGLSGQMHGLVCLDAAGVPLRPAIIWADTRATAEIEPLEQLQKEISAVLPGPPAAGFAAASALWLRRHQPQILAQTKTILCPKDYLRLRLTGLTATDPSDAAGTWLFDIAQGKWAAEVVQFCGLDSGQMPEVRASAAVCGTLMETAARELGLPAGIPVVTGSADLPAQALGHAVLDPDQVLVVVGSGGQVFKPQRSPFPDSQGRFYSFTHNVPGCWYAQAAILSAGLSLRWLRDILGLAGRPDAYTELSRLAAGVPPGSEGLLFLPYLSGERSPIMDPRASGLFLGLQLHHGPGHLARAVMEGVGFALRDCLELVGAGPGTLTLSGGVTQSAVWPQILADVWQRPLHIPVDDLPRACLGAAILAGIGVGLHADIHEAAAVRREALSLVNPKETSVYTDRYSEYKRLYPLLKENMQQLRGK